MVTAVVHPIVPILNQNGAHASSPVVDAQFTTETIANVETHIISEMIAHTIPDRSCRSLRATDPRWQSPLSDRRSHPRAGHRCRRLTSRNYGMARDARIQDDRRYHRRT